MNGLTLSKAFYEAVRPQLAAEIPDVLEHAAAGLSGPGSECFGFDDQISHDHDFGAGFCFWVPKALLMREKSRIEAAFAGLPESWNGFPTRRFDPMGRVGPRSVEGFFTSTLGREVPRNAADWLDIPECRLAEATNGELFEDREGLVTDIRKELAFYPREVFLTKLAARTMQMAQAGQYNYGRALRRNDAPSAFLSLARFMEAAASFVHLCNKRYTPFYKHAAKSACALPLLGNALERVLTVITESNSAQNGNAQEAIEEFAEAVVLFLREESLSRARGIWLWEHGPSIMEGVRDPALRARNILEL
ncbi:MAG: DUF4037 domain-containing protein [Desulfovibrio sp.]|nr:DUF4037 domain-containing protein [Desulfovibrio sp.]